MKYRLKHLLNRWNSRKRPIRLVIVPRPVRWHTAGNSSIVLMNHPTQPSILERGDCLQHDPVKSTSRRRSAFSVPFFFFRRMHDHGGIKTKHTITLNNDSFVSCWFKRKRRNDPNQLHRDTGTACGQKEAPNFTLRPITLGPADSDIVHTDHCREIP